jgi:hypothetical protein
MAGGDPPSRVHLDLTLSVPQMGNRGMVRLCEGIYALNR